MGWGRRSALGAGAAAIVVAAGVTVGLRAGHGGAPAAANPVQLAVDCFGTDVAPSALNRPADAERGSDPASRALHTFLNGGENFLMTSGPPALAVSGWTRLSTTPTTALFAHRSAPAAVYDLAVWAEKKSSGWVVSGDATGGTGCDLHDLIRVDPQSPIVPWTDPSVTGNQVTVDVDPCSGTFAHADVAQSATAVTITVHVHPSAIPVTACVPGNLVAATVVLPSPLEGRTLLDGYHSPPRPPSALPRP